MHRASPLSLLLSALVLLTAGCGGARPDDTADGGPREDASPGCVPAAERCDGEGDEDCDGRVDEGCGCEDGQTRSCGTAIGACEAGMETCAEGAFGACEGAVSPTDEACDGALDDDCDGTIDEGCGCASGETRPCGLDTGACVAGAQSCVAGTWSACEGATDPGLEACDGTLDEDCDGLVDEGCACTDGAARPCGSDLGACTAGAQTCVGGGWEACAGATGPGSETCDGALDQDCDGLVDEGCACTDGATRPCGSDVGACVAGTETCAAGGWGSCVGDTGPRTEACDGSLDENCDGVVDEGCACTDGATRSCGSDVGACTTGTQTCSSGAWSGCAGASAPGTETCDGSLDEDCDGLVDEGCDCTNGATRGCGSDTGACVAGTQTCGAGAWGACAGAVGPGTETCDGTLDEDCDGVVDEGCDCTNGTTQACGLDVGACVAGSQTCTAGRWGACGGGTGPATETCDGLLDEDCDGVVDEGCACTDGATRACGSDVGACVAGTQACSAGAWGSCTGAIGASPELCGGGVDEDCDGTIDEGCDCRTGRCAYGTCDPTTGSCDATASFTVHEVVGWEQIHLHATRGALWHLSTEYYHHIDATGATRRRYVMPRDQIAFDLAPARSSAGTLDFAIGTRDTTGGGRRCFFQLGADGAPIRYGDEVAACDAVHTEARYVGGRLHALLAAQVDAVTVALHHYEETASGVVRTDLGSAAVGRLVSTDFHVDAAGEPSVLLLATPVAGGRIEAWRVTPDGAGGFVFDDYQLLDVPARVSQWDGAMSPDGGFHFVRTLTPATPTSTADSSVELHSYDGAGWTAREIFRGPADSVFGRRPAAAFDADGRLHVAVADPTGTFRHLHETAPGAWVVDTYPNSLVTLSSSNGVLSSALAFDPAGRVAFAYAVTFGGGVQRGYVFVPSPL